jgi:glutamine synthetase
MTLTPRQAAVRAISSDSQAEGDVRYTEDSITETYGSLVFGDNAQRKHLPRDVYKRLRRTIHQGEKLDASIADSVANGMKDWAVSHGATHYSHWFQPMTGATAEKQDSFITPTGSGTAILEFSGKELTQGEPDASSLPSGGIRATFEARGYTAWDPTSPAFLRHTPNGVTLTIPTAFCSWTGDALDTKTPLLRSGVALDRAARRLLEHLRQPGEERASRVFANIGPEQEFFLVNRELFYLRPDLMACGRTLFGAPPPKGQEQDDHYFATTPSRVMALMQSLERKLWQLGIPIKTRHNEVAPGQYEMAPIYEGVTVASDHNMLMMDLLHEVSDEYGFRCLLHEKPYQGLNGSGKHDNYSIGDDLGNNMLDPGDDPQENQRFMVFLTALIAAVDRHQDLLRASIAYAGNDHRLGANEAPPAIISIFLGSDLQAVVDAIIAGKSAANDSSQSLHLGVDALPFIPRDTTDRNRTSPFAFTGNKFEFRALGSSQSIAYPNYILNTIVAEALDDLSAAIEALPKDGRDPAAIQSILRASLTEHQKILFTGDNYSDEWEAEAERRGLLNLRNTPDALARLNDAKNVELFAHYKVLSKREWLSRTEIVAEAYQEKLRVESRVAIDMAATLFIPAAMRAQKKTADAILATREAAPGLDLGVQIRHLTRITELHSELQAGIDDLRAQLALDAHFDSPIDEAAACRDTLIPAMDKLRSAVDQLEALVADDLWPIPKYRELLTIT